MNEIASKNKGKSVPEKEKPEMSSGGKPARKIVMYTSPHIGYKTIKRLKELGVNIRKAALEEGLLPALKKAEAEK
jgi:hypothetical protein